MGNPSAASKMNIWVICIVVLCCVLVLLALRWQWKRWKEEKRRKERARAEQKRRREVIEQFSQKIHKVEALNHQYEFLPVPEIVFINRVCQSKAEYDRVEFRALLRNAMIEREEKYRALIADTERNIQDNNRYLAEIKNIQEKSDEIDQINYSTYPFFYELEKVMIQSIQKKPTTAVSVQIQKSYISPQGRNSYSNTEMFSFQEVVSCFQEAQTVLKNRQTREYQRKIMTDSLRYDVMKRDGFRCVLCGASAKEGAKLHVDHIIPVSRGGKTEMQNLRTLCEHCNFGKRDKYDPYGPN